MANLFIITVSFGLVCFLLVKEFLFAVERESIAAKAHKGDEAIGDTQSSIEVKSTETMLTEVIAFGINRQGALESERLMLLDILRQVRKFYNGVKAKVDAPAVEQSISPAVEQSAVLVGQEEAVKDDTFGVTGFVHPNDPDVYH